jgi:hypothetical protein
MTEPTKLIYPILLLTPNFFFGGKKATDREMKLSDSEKTAPADNLKFTFGIRSIFQDSKVNRTAY